MHWKSSFDGGDPQIFTAHAFIGQEETSQSKPIADTGENKIHNTIVQNLQPSTMYIFYIHAKNKHGISSSKNTSCVTLAKGKYIIFGMGKKYFYILNIVSSFISFLSHSEHVNGIRSSSLVLRCPSYGGYCK